MKHHVFDKNGSKGTHHRAVHIYQLEEKVIQIDSGSNFDAVDVGFICQLASCMHANGGRRERL
jgi:hypothetical protein